MSGLAGSVKNFPPASEWFHLSPADKAKIRRAMVSEVLSKLPCSVMNIRLGVKLSRQEMLMLAEDAERGRRFSRHLIALTNEKFSEFKKLSIQERLEYLEKHA